MRIVASRVEAWIEIGRVQQERRGGDVASRVEAWIEMIPRGIIQPSTSCRLSRRGVD